MSTLSALPPAGIRAFKKKKICIYIYIYIYWLTVKGYHQNILLKHASLGVGVVSNYKESSNKN